MVTTCSHVSPPHGRHELVSRLLVADKKMLWRGLLLLQLLLLLLLHPAWPSTVLDSIFLPFYNQIKCEWLKHRKVALWQAPWR